MTQRRIDTTDPSATFRAFAEDGKWWGTRLGALTTLKNGFEKWLATEWLLWMRAVPFEGLQDGARYDRVGIEAKALLAPDLKYGDRKKVKQVDFWWALDDADAGPWNFVELKVVFNNENADKMFKSAGWDLWYLSRLVADEHPHAAAVIVVGQDFDDSGWKAGIATVNKESDGVALPGSDGRLGRLRWQSWQKTFG